MDLSRRLVAESRGTAFLRTCVVGSGIMAGACAAATPGWRCWPMHGPRVAD